MDRYFADSKSRRLIPPPPASSTCPTTCDRVVPGPDSYGLTGPETSLNQLQPHLLYPYDGTPWFLALPPLKVALPAEIQPGHSWNQNGWQLTATEARTEEN
ncbi:hypothetical protein E3A20_29530, partial [Planctomyces bekefii]